MTETRFTATKFDAGKPPMQLIPWEAMQGVSQVLDFGRQKYAEHNWRNGFLWGRLAGAALRHVFSWLGGEDKDPESGLSHIDHAICCLMFLSAHIKSKLGKDDRCTFGTSATDKDASFDCYNEGFICLRVSDNTRTGIFETKEIAETHRQAFRYPDDWTLRAVRIEA